MSSKDTRVPDVTLERFRLGELPPAQAAELRARLESESELRGRLEALERSDAELGRVQAQALAAGVVERLGRRPAAAAGAAWQRPLLAAAAAVLVAGVLAPRLLGPRAERPGDDLPAERAKGGASLLVYRATSDGAEQLADGTPVHAGDRIRVGYRVRPGRYGVIVSVDGRGQVTRHLPAAGERAAPLGSGGRALLDAAFELDDAPRWERLFLVVGDAPFDVALVLEAARRVDTEGPVEAEVRLRLPAGLEQHVISLAKESGR